MVGTLLDELQAEDYAKLSEMLYVSYCKATGGLNFRGEQVPTWEELPEKQKTAWLATAYTAHDAFFLGVLK